MNWTCIFGILIILSSGAASRAVAQAGLGESFNAATLNSRLYTTASSSAYSVGQLTSGSTWQMSKQAGTSTGSVEIHTNFKVSGNFTATLTLNRANLGTGEVGFRFGEFWTFPIAELYARDDEVIQSEYVSGGYGIAGYPTTDPNVTLQLVRSGTQIKGYASGHLFSISDYSGTDFVTIFLRPNSGNGAFDPTVGQSDPHSAVLDQFTLIADAFVPEPASLSLMLCGLTFGWMTRRSRRARRRVLV